MIFRGMPTHATSNTLGVKLKNINMALILKSMYYISHVKPI